MNFSQKRTCKGCQLECMEICGVRIEKGLLEADKPLEPCYKPRTQNELNAFKLEIQLADLAIYREE